jgi:small glutamine-rich tetratricopeptide repeat-containing protein alpha
MSSAKTQLVQSIISFLQSEKQTEAASLLGKSYGVEASSQFDLAAIFEAHVASAKPAAAAPADIDNDPKFIEFINLLKGKGYFKNVAEGSAQYADRLSKAKEKFLERNKPAAGAAPAAAAPAIDTVKAEKFKDEGNELLRQKKFKEAIAKYKQALECNPRSHIYYTNMAAAYLHQRDYDHALESCEKALEINDQYSKAYKWLGQTYESLDKYQEALENYEQALRLEPDNDDFKRKVKLMQEKVDEADAEDMPDLTDARGNVVGHPGGMGGMGGMPPGMGGLGGLGGMFGGMNPMDMLGAMGGGGGGGGMPDLGSLLGNPQFMEFAQNMMQNPQMRQMVSGMASQMGINMDENGVPQLSSEQLDELAQDPSVQASPKLQRVVEEMRVAGMEAVKNYEGDAEVMEFVQGAMQRLLSSAAGGLGGLGGLGGMFGGR